MTTIYLAGPMTGVKDYNFPLFFEVERALKDMGYDVENPAKNNGETLYAAIVDAQSEARSWAEYMKLDLVRLARADAVCLLPGWQTSRGARLEARIALDLGMELFAWLSCEPEDERFVRTDMYHVRWGIGSVEVAA